MTKSKQDINPDLREQAIEFLEDLADDGRLLEGGFAAFSQLFDASDDLLFFMRFAFMSGADHLWSSLKNIITPDKDLSEADKIRLDKIDEEMQSYRQEMIEVLSILNDSRSNEGQEDEGK